MKKNKEIDKILDVMLNVPPNEELGGVVLDEIAERLYDNGLRFLKNKKIKFVLDGCDISFVAEAPADITIEQLIEQCDKIKPMWCACGISSLDKKGYCEDIQTDIIIGYDDIKKTNEGVSCWIDGQDDE